MATSSSAPNNASPSSGLSGPTAVAPKGAIPKKMIAVVLGVIGAVVVGAKFIDDLRQGTFVEDGPKQAARSVVGGSERITVVAAANTGIEEVTKNKDLTDEQVKAAINAPAGMTAAQAALAARAAEIPKPNPAPANAPADIAERTASKTFDPNADVSSLNVLPPTRPSSAPAANAPQRPQNGYPSAGDGSSQMSAEERAARDAALQKEKDVFSMRNSAIFASPASGGSEGLSRSRTTDELGANRQTPTAESADPIASYLQLLSRGAAAGAASSANSTQSSWSNQQRNEALPTAAYSAPALPGEVLLPGSVISLVTRTTIRSDLEGDFIAQVTDDVYDTVNARRIIIPKGSRILGTAASDLKPGQERALTAFKTLYFPDGRSFDLRGSQGSDREGAAGFDADVNRHLFKKFGVGVILAAIAYAVDRKNPNNQVVVVGSTPAQQQQTLGVAAGKVMADSASSYMEQQRAIADVLTVPAGYLFTIIIKSPLVLNPTFTRSPK
jgi:type IV secretion system protein TrbI